MHLLLTNDDGYNSEGMRCLTKALIKAGHRVTIAAPDSERSAASHALSILKPLRARPINIEGANGWAIDGTPADCVRLGLHLTKNDRPDMCVSGINHGSNLGGACVYSGTVNSAMEASMAGCPAIAASLEKSDSYDFTKTCELTLKLITYAAEHPLKRGRIYNLNLPAKDDIKGVFFTQTLGPDFLSEANYQAITSNYGITFYCLDDGPNLEYFPPDCDSVKCAEGWATVSVLGWDLSEKRDGSIPENGEMELI